jgi:hypothetical protein
MHSSSARALIRAKGAFAAAGCGGSAARIASAPSLAVRSATRPVFFRRRGHQGLPVWGGERLPSPSTVPLTRRFHCSGRLRCGRLHRHAERSRHPKFA